MISSPAKVNNVVVSKGYNKDEATTLDKDIYTWKTIRGIPSRPIKYRVGTKVRIIIIEKGNGLIDIEIEKRV